MHSKFDQIMNDDSIRLKINCAVSFTKDEHEYHKQMAQMKIQAKLKSNMSISNYGSTMTSTEKETMSIASEIAFCRMVNLPDPDEKEIINNRAFDFKLFGKTIDVKATMTLNPRLVVSVGRLYKNYADIFVLMRQKTIYEFVFLGCVKKENIIKPENIKKPFGFRNEVYLSTNLKDLELP